MDCPRNFLFFFRGKIKFFLLCLKIGWSDFCFGCKIFYVLCEFFVFLVFNILHIWICFQKTDHPFFSDFCFSSQKLFVYDSVFKKTVHPFLVFFFSSYENWLSIFFSCLWRLVFLLLKFSLTFIFIEVFDLFSSGFHCLCHFVVHFFIYTLHVMMHQLKKETTRWHGQWKLETNRLNTLINMKVRENSQHLKNSLLRG